MEVEIGYKYRFYPTEEQKTLLSSIFGCTRFAYNWFLNFRSNRYKNTGTDLNYNEASAWWTIVKGFDTHEWLNEVASTPTQQALRHCDAAFKKFFNKESEYPVFKKKGGDQSATFVASNFNFDSSSKQLKLMGLGILNIRWHRSFQGKVSGVTITKNSANHYFVSFHTVVGKEPLPKTGSSVGIDLGLKDLVVCSDGTKVPNPKFLARAMKQLRHLQREFSRKKKGSNRRSKARLKLAKAHERVSNIRKDFLHRLTLWIVKTFDLIKMEDLNVKGMLKNHKLALAISDVGWGMFKKFLDYKCEWYGKQLGMIDRFFPSSKMCHCCGHINEDLTLADREWVCPRCGMHLDRDINAAINILNAVGYTVSGRGGNVRFSKKGEPGTKRSRRSVNHLVPKREL